MKAIILLSSIFLFFVGCTNQPDKNIDKTKSTQKEDQDIELKPKVTGIGGVFFKSENPKELTKWYETNLGFVTDDFGIPFFYRNANPPFSINHARWRPFENDTQNFRPSDKDFLITYRVQNIERLVQNLKSNNITIILDVTESQYGKSAHILDCENNKIELWEPIDSFFTEMAEINSDTNDENLAKGTGIGGIFFKCENPEKLKNWYSDNLGLAINEYGSSFEFRNLYNKDEINYLQWSPFSENTEYFDPSDKDLMINYRVQNIEILVDKLRNNGVTILDEMVNYSYGKFIHILDSEGNKVELWEPIDSVFTEMGGETTK